jgi:hypothetical protein
MALHLRPVAAGDPPPLRLALLEIQLRALLLARRSGRPSDLLLLVADCAEMASEHLRLAEASNHLGAAESFRALGAELRRVACAEPQT